MSQSWFLDAFRAASAFLDRTVYGLVTIFYQLFLDLTNIDIFSDETIYVFTRKLYVLIGLFMLFKVSFSFINYIVNPDSFFDKQKGVQKLILRIIITLMSLTLIPFGFTMLRKAQTAILDDNTIPKFILGQDTDEISENKFYISQACEGNEPAEAKNQANFLALISFRPFFQPNYENFDQNDTSQLPQLYCSSFANATVSSYLVDSIYMESSNNYYIIEYNAFISTIVGIVIVLFLLSFCFDIAVRSLKLGFLEIIAPIPIISYIDPKQGKDGMLMKWLKEVGRTWADLFIRMAAVFFVVFIVSLLESNSIDYNGAESSHFWLMLFIFLGALIFAKRLPKLIEQITGFKLSGSVQLNPFKKVSEQALFGKQVVGTAGALGAGALGLGMSTASHTIAAVNKRHEFKKEQGKIDAVKNEETALRNKLQDQQSLSAKINDRKKELAHQMLFANDPNEKNKLRQAWQKADDKSKSVNKEIKGLESAMAEKTNKREEMETKLKEDKEKSKLFRHPISGTLGEATTGAYNAMKNGYKNPSKVYKNARLGVKSGIDRRNYYEDFSWKDKIYDKYTDFAGIRGSSGTSSEVKNSIKDYKNELVRVEQYLKMLNESLANTQGASQAVNYNTTEHKYEISNNYYGDNRNELIDIISKLNNTIDQKLNIEKNIDRLTKQQERGQNIISKLDNK